MFRHQQVVVLVFEVEADDGVDLISRGRHERYVIDSERFTAKVRRKKERT